jgi:hypothetical protein
VKIDGKLRVFDLLSRLQDGERFTMPRVRTVYEAREVSRKMTISKVTLNEPMQDALFQKPQLAMAGVPGR